MEVFYIIGINDNLEIIGVNKNLVDEYMTWISNKLSSNIFNYILEEVTIHCEEVEGLIVLVISIKAGSKSIYYELSKGIYSGSYIRVGSTTQLMTRMKVDSIEQKFIQIELSMIKAQYQMYEISILKEALIK